MNMRSQKLMRVVLAALCIFAFFILLKQPRLLNHEPKQYFTENNENKRFQRLAKGGITANTDNSEVLANEKLIPNEKLKSTRHGPFSEGNYFEKNIILASTVLKEQWRKTMKVLKASSFASSYSSKAIEAVRSTDSAMLYTKTLENPMKNLGKSGKNKILCEIPNLNPFDKVAMKYIENRAPHDCGKKDHGVLTKGIFKFKADGLRAAFFRYIRRVEDDDFKIFLSKPEKLLKQKIKQAPIAKGMVGCFVNANGTYFGIGRDSGTNRLPDAVKLSELEECYPRNYVRILANGQLQDFAKGETCFVLPDNRDDQIKQTGCGDEKARHRVIEGSIFQHVDTKKCLSVNTSSEDLEQRIFLTEKCTNSSNRYLQFQDFPPVHNIETEIKVEEEFIEMVIATEKAVIIEHYADIKPLSAKKSMSNNAAGRGLKYSVAFLLFDSQSAANVARKLQKTLAFIRDKENAVILKGHTINGDGTTAQLCAMFTGAMEEDLPEARRGEPGSSTVDSWPFLFKNFSAQNYVTMYSEDDSDVATFNYRLKGFKRQPTDHYSRPFWSRAARSFHSGFCIGGKTTFQVGLNYTMSFHDAYKENLRFSLTIFSNLFHNDMNAVENADEDILNFLKRFEQRGHLDNTILFVGADHGPRVGSFRETLQGKLEERLPFMALLLPPKLVKQHKEFMDALKHNSNLLTTHFDIHATLCQILSHPQKFQSKSGQSLFTRIDASKRTCKSSGIQDHWCPCLQYSDVNITNPKVIEAAKAVVVHINDKIIGVHLEAMEKCQTLELSSVKRAALKQPQEAVQVFVRTSKNSKCDECGIVTGGKANANIDSAEYEVVFSVQPSKALFEAKVARNGSDWIVDKNISRLNLYGNQPHCVQDKYPYLRKFCYCK
ncbi:uncharacterized protein LOC135692547 [Rhopilema esculentum]|uniref:uncharacterized protein LOC135692547 n=1 Tax=Rhopilema esculentum TaxID=499914 RepID=UPI0031E0E1B2